MAKGTSSFIGWLVGIAMLVAAVIYWRISLVLFAALVALGLVIWFVYSLLSKTGRAQSAIDQNDYASALQLLMESEDSDQLISALRFKVPFPSSEVRERLLEAVRQLISLREAASDPANTFLPDALREDLERRTRDSLASLWPLCQKLSLLARSKVSEELLSERIANVTGQLEELGRNAEATRHQLALITLGASELEINGAIEQVGAMKWQVNETQKLDEMLES